jgi:sugar phosphate permease
MPSLSPTPPASTSESAVVQHALRRRWLRILPAAFITYSLAYLDRANFGFGTAAGMATTLHLTGNRISLLSSLFFLGYFGFQVPGIRLARRYSATRVVAITLIIWGALAALTGVLHQFWLLALDRLLLGVAESLVFPAMLLLLTHWFSRSERSRANTLLMFGNPVTVLWMSAITGFLIQAVGWQHTFIIEGIPSILWAFLWVRLVRDHPHESPWLPSEAAAELETTLHAEQAGIAPVKNLRACFFRRDVVVLCLQYFCWSLGVYGFVLWLPTIVRAGASLSMGKTGLLTALPYLAAIIGEWLVATFSDRTGNRVGWVWPSLLISGAALMGSFLLANHSFPLAFACLIVAGGCMYAPYGPFFAIVPERVPRNVTGEVMALVNSAGALGGFVGSYVVGALQSLTGNSRAGFLVMSLSLALSAMLILCIGKVPTAAPNLPELKPA